MASHHPGGGGRHHLAQGAAAGDPQQQQAARHLMQHHHSSASHQHSAQQAHYHHQHHHQQQQQAAAVASIVPGGGALASAASHHSQHQHHHSSSGAAAAASASGVNGSSSSSSKAGGASHQLTPQERDRYIEKFDFMYCAKVDKYEKMTKIGQGTFGEVFKARLRTDKNKIVALKKVLMDNEKEGFPITALREIKILQLLNHENIVNLIEICRQYSRHNKTTFYLVFDFCEHDLAGLLSNVNVKFNLGEIKKVMQQMFEGLFYIHSNKIIHRDMKAANILITKQGILKLADFGLARAISINKSQPNRYTNRVVTLWYRPPELLLGERNYGPPVDLWGAGCIMAEMWTRSPIMQGNTEQHQITMIAQLCGAITPEVWPGVDKLELFNKVDLPKTSKRRVKERLKPYVKDAFACDLIDKCLLLDPSKRTDADTALNHDFFWTDPMPCSLERMLSNHVQSMFEYLAPRRGGAHVAQQQPQPRNPNNEGYKDMVY